MTPKEFNNRIDRLIVALGDPTLDIIERVGLNMKAQINRRIVSSGTGADGSPLKPYSPKYLQFKTDVGRNRGFVDYQLGNYSINKRIDAVENRRKNQNDTLREFQELGGARKAKKRKGKTAGELKELKSKRRAKALPQGAALWNSIGVIEKKDESGKLHVRISARDDFNQKKLQGLSFGNGRGQWRGRGDVLAASLDEQLNASVKFTEDFGKMVQQIFAE